MLMPIPMHIVEPATAEGRERLARTMDRNMMIYCAAIIVAGTASSVALLGVPATAAGAVPIVALSAALAWLIERTGVLLSEIVLGAMGLVTLCFAVTAFWITA